VYYEDTDAAGVVYYANYLKFYERARTEWLRAQGFEQDQLRDSYGIVFVVSALQVNYLRSARFNDALQVSCRLKKQSAAALHFEQKVVRTSGGALLSQASVQIVCVDAISFKPKPIPKGVDLL
jgi:acyl-CoA thioester hydrolase